MTNRILVITPFFVMAGSGCFEASSTPNAPDGGFAGDAASTDDGSGEADAGNDSEPPEPDGGTTGGNGGGADGGGPGEPTGDGGAECRSLNDPEVTRHFSTAECRTVLFSCELGERQFQDDCGCGCETTSCEAQDARGEGLCRLLAGYGWNGEQCAAINCRCVGEDCDDIYDSLRECQRAHAFCELPEGCSGCCDCAPECTQHADCAELGAEAYCEIDVTECGCHRCVAE